VTLLWCWSRLAFLNFKDIWAAHIGITYVLDAWFVTVNPCTSKNTLLKLFVNALLAFLTTFVYRALRIL
jgi:hypothetical protein